MSGNRAPTGARSPGKPRQSPRIGNPSEPPFSAARTRILASLSCKSGAHSDGAHGRRSCGSGGQKVRARRLQAVILAEPRGFPDGLRGRGTAVSDRSTDRHAPRRQPQRPGAPACRPAPPRAPPGESHGPVLQHDTRSLSRKVSERCLIGERRFPNRTRSMVHGRLLRSSIISNLVLTGGTDPPWQSQLSDAALLGRPRGLREQTC